MHKFVFIYLCILNIIIITDTIIFTIGMLFEVYSRHTGVKHETPGTGVNRRITSLPFP